MDINISKPDLSEHAPHFSKYIDMIGEENVITFLAEQKNDLIKLIKSISEEKGNYKYAPEKWTIKEVIGHIIDSDRVYGFRALYFARGGTSALPGYDQDVWAKEGAYNSLSLDELIADFELAREANISLFKRLSVKDCVKTGIANNNRMSVRAIAYIIGGHTAHHVNVIREMYL
jgi:hypothetical protein